MEILRFALGARFAPKEGNVDAAFQAECLGAFLAALAPGDVEGLSLYAGLDDKTEPDSPAWIVVLMGASLKEARRAYYKLRETLAPRLCQCLPFIESNRIAHLSGLAYYGRAGKDGIFTGGEPLPC